MSYSVAECARFEISLLMILRKAPFDVDRLSRRAVASLPCRPLFLLCSAGLLVFGQATRR